jgi:hypothetical protein
MSENFIQISEVLERTSGIVITLAAQQIKDGCEGNKNGRIYLGKPKQRLRSFQFHDDEEIEMAVR